MINLKPFLIEIFIPIFYIYMYIFKHISLNITRKIFIHNMFEFKFLYYHWVTYDMYLSKVYLFDFLTIMICLLIGTINY